ncbi:UNVERIFIED_CONTAM: hypothetical protein PYX00_002314 [Menopon gallinae]|uniref:Reverse transcriptase domain-containing protein n=1 Tax=Menopon gallinae TaxID=328185 RepID=A0AAW2IGM2_9NEOP
MPSGNQFIECYRNSETLKNANENVQKIFKMYNQSQQYKTEAYRKAMMDRVRSHQLDESSDEVKLARLTAQVRIYQYFAKLKSSKGKYRRILNSLIHRRRRGLRKLREKDYKKYEWLLEKLDLKYTADPICFDNPGKKKSTTLLAQVKKQKMKEQKLAEYKKTLDQQKIPYLKNKLEKLKWIKEQESAANLEPTVLDSDLEEIVKKIEQVKLNIEAAEKRGYARTVHPYTLEVYYPKAVGLRQGCMLSPLLFITYMDWMLRRSRGSGSFRYGDLEVGHLAYADDLVLLGSTQSELQRALDGFDAVCTEAGMRISLGKSEVMEISRKPGKCDIRLGGVALRQVEKFKYLGVWFTSDGGTDEEIASRIGRAGAVMQQLVQLVMGRWYAGPG